VSSLGVKIAYAVERTREQAVTAALPLGSRGARTSSPEASRDMYKDSISTGADQAEVDRVLPQPAVRCEVKTSPMEEEGVLP